jgi:hypothetical protein
MVVVMMVVNLCIPRLNPAPNSSKKKSRRSRSEKRGL